VITGKIVSEAGNFMHLQMSKITTRAKSNKISFNEEKSKIMLISRRKRKELIIFKQQSFRRSN